MTNARIVNETYQVADGSQLPYHPLSSDETARIDAVRGFLCISIFFFHYYSTYLQYLETTPDYFHRILNEGYVAVYIFFALSGFLIFNSFSKLLIENHSRAYAVFFLKRIFRIFPAWFVALFFYSIYRDQHEVGRFFWDFFLLFGLQPYELAKLTVIHSWTLYVEEIFYLSFPVFVLVIKKKLVPQAILVFLLIKVYINYIYQVPAGMHFHTPFTSFHYFAYGIAAYFLLPYFRRINLSKVGFLFVLILVAAVSYLVKRKMVLLEAYVLFWFIFIPAAPEKLSRPIIQIFSPVGRYCFSFYLMHLLPIWMLPWTFRVLSLPEAENKELNIIFKMGVSFGLAILMGYVLYHLVEKPFIKLGKKLSEKWLSEGTSY